MGSTSASGGGRRTLRRALVSGLISAGLIGGVAFVARLPEEVDLAQAAEEPPADDCGTRPPKPAPPSTTTTAPSTATSASTAPSSTDASTTTSAGEIEAAAAGSSGYWRCSFVEDFEGTELDEETWFVQTTTQGNFGVGGECFVDSPDNISVGDGNLKLTVRKEAEPIACPRANNPAFVTPYTAGSIITRPKLDQAYGRYEIRARMPSAAVPGLHFAFWLWPRDLTTYPAAFGEGDGDRWTNGELDVLEWYSRYPYHQVPYIHYAHTYAQTSTGRWVPNDPNITKACLVGTMSEWHTFALEWTATSIRMLYDGKVCLENTHWTPRNTTMPGPFDQPFMVSLTQGLGAIGTDNQAGSYTPLPATAEVDYLKVWR
jgi:beta-glucanase (GH16 family)